MYGAFRHGLLFELLDASSFTLICASESAVYKYCYRRRLQGKLRLTRPTIFKRTDIIIARPTTRLPPIQIFLVNIWVELPQSSGSTSRTTASNGQMRLFSSSMLDFRQQAHGNGLPTVQTNRGYGIAMCRIVRDGRSPVPS